MAALLSDVRRELSTRQLQPLDGIFFSQVLYADDTLIFGANLHNASTHIDMQLKNIQNTLGSTWTMTNALIWLPIKASLLYISTSHQQAWGKAN